MAVNRKERSEKRFPQPIIVVSKCLSFAPVRYNGQVLDDAFVLQLKDHVKFIPVCPEVEIGLGVPRKTVRVVETEGVRRLIQPETGRDVTDEMNQFSEKFLGSLGEVDGFLLKSRSPTSGIKDVKIYPGTEKVAAIAKGAGFFGGKAIDKFAPLAIEDEGRLTNFDLRESFLTRVFGHADLRRVMQGGRMKDLIDFHSRYKYLLMAYSQKELRLLGRIVANHDKLPFAELAEEYEKHFNLALAKPPRRTYIINVLMHLLGYFSGELTSGEKAFFLDLLESYRAAAVPLSALQAVLRSWMAKYKRPYLEGQAFFEPFPKGLIVTRDSGKGIQG